MTYSHYYLSPNTSSTVIMKGCPFCECSLDVYVIAALNSGGKE